MYKFGPAIIAALIALFTFLENSRAATTSRAVQVPQGTRTGFSEIANLAGIHFTNAISQDKGLENQIRLNGCGVAAGDIDGDGLPELYFCSNLGGNALFKNRGNFKFEAITPAVLRCPGQFSTSAAFVDVDGDGDLDLLVGGLGVGVRLFLNDGKGTFSESTESGLIQKYGATSLTLADVDGDGDLDLYVANYSTRSLTDDPNTRFHVQRVNGNHVITEVNGVSILNTEMEGTYSFDPNGVIRQGGEPDILYLNDGKGHFTVVSWTNGFFLDEKGKALTAPVRDWGLTAMFRDFNGDGLPDLYVCNDLFSPDRVWINKGGGRFQASQWEMLRHTPMFSMGVDFADIDRDGFDDFFVCDMLSRHHQKRMVQVVMPKKVPPAPGEFKDRPQIKRNCFYHNRQDGTYQEIAQYCGLNASEWSWTPIFLDVDLDGYEDLLISTGHYRDSLHGDADRELNRRRARAHLTVDQIRELNLLFPRLNTAKQAFRNLGNLRFEDKGAEWGFDQVGISHGMCLVDLDGDGDLDVVVNNLNEEAGVYRNESGAPRVGVRLKGKGPNTRGIGAKIYLYGGAVPMQSQEMICGGRYLSSDDAMRTFAAGSLSNEMRIEVKWRSGSRSVVKGVKANTIWEVDEAEAQESEEPRKPEVKPLFEEASQYIQHQHHEEEYDDYARQPLLARKLSQLGPGVAWCDLNGDGREDLVVGSGKGGELEILYNQGAGHFSRLKTGESVGKASDDQTTVLGLNLGPDNGLLLVGQASYESGGSNALTIYQVGLGGIRAVGNLSLGGSSCGPVALGDVDGDGDLDLFVGGRVVPGRYPEGAISRLYEKTSQGYKPVQEFKGLVSGAVFSDLDGDGYPELLLACEWGPVRVYKRVGGKYEEEQVGLEKYVGWWNGVSTGDFDGDGKLDIVASNWGGNTRYEHKRAKGLRVHYGEWNGSVGLVESYWDEELKKEVPWRGLDILKRGLPELGEKYSTYASYAEASVSEILMGKTEQVVAINTLESMVFLNRGDHFEGHELPMEAQWAPCFGVSVGDVDGDGVEDLFLSQNFFEVDEDTSRYDGGRGVLLKGVGDGSFKSVPGQESGIRMYGEGRGSAFCDYDGDGRMDLAVAQNGAGTKLYRNVEGKAGIRVRLKGPLENGSGVGAVVRVKNGGKWGPAHEIKCGSGYWSQESSVLILPPGEEIQVRWPGGKITNSTLPKDAEVEIDYHLDSK